MIDEADKIVCGEVWTWARKVYKELDVLTKELILINGLVGTAVAQFWRTVG